MAENGKNGWKCWKQLEQLEMANGLNSWKLLEMAGNCSKWLQMVGKDENGLNGLEWYGMA